MYVGSTWRNGPQIGQYMRLIHLDGTVDTLHECPASKEADST